MYEYTFLMYIYAPALHIRAGRFFGKITNFNIFSRNFLCILTKNIFPKPIDILLIMWYNIYNKEREVQTYVNQSKQSRL